MTVLDQIHAELDSVSGQQNSGWHVRRAITPLLVQLEDLEEHVIVLADLPITDPLVDNAIWNNDGTPEISAGA